MPSMGCPATEWMSIAEADSSSESGGRIEGRHRASMVLPEPGGPIMRRP